MSKQSTIDITLSVAEVKALVTLLKKEDTYLRRSGEVLPKDLLTAFEYLELLDYGQGLDLPAKQ